MSTLVERIYGVSVMLVVCTLHCQFLPKYFIQSGGWCNENKIRVWERVWVDDKKAQSPWNEGHTHKFHFMSLLKVWVVFTGGRPPFGQVPPGQGPWTETSTPGQRPHWDWHLVAATEAGASYWNAYFSVSIDHFTSRESIRYLDQTRTQKHCSQWEPYGISSIFLNISQNPLLNSSHHM